MTVQRPPQPMLDDATVGPLVREFVRRLNSVAKPAGTRVSSWFRTSGINAAAGGADLSQHLAALAADFVTPAPHQLVAELRRAGLHAIYHNVGSGWHVHVQAYPAGFIARLVAQRPRLAVLLGLRRAAPAPALPWAPAPAARTIFT